MKWKILEGDSVEILRTLPDESIHCMVTSPPYFGLRSYLDETDANKALEIGHEQTPEEYVAKLVEIFREVWRVLRKDGCVFLNLGDSYAGSGSPGGDFRDGKGGDTYLRPYNRKGNGLKPKDLMMIPARVALALQADGWWLRSDVIWSKPNPMPEAVTDRCTNSHEHIFLLTKSARYFYDADAIKEDNANPNRKNYTPGKRAYAEGNTESCPCQRTRRNDGFEKYANGEICVGRNKRSVWTIATTPYPGAHFATFPEEIPRTCILAGTSERGCCPDCGAPWERVLVPGEPDEEHKRLCGADSDGNYNGQATKDYKSAKAENPSDVKRRILDGMRKIKEMSWKPSCHCYGIDIIPTYPRKPKDEEKLPQWERDVNAWHDDWNRLSPIYADLKTVPCTVLDIFSGAGTTGVVCKMLNRDYIGIDLNPEYAEMSRDRIRSTRKPSKDLGGYL